MNGACQTPEPTLCGCCEGVSPETPQPVTNRPALSSVAYRVGTYATFNASMLAALSDPNLLALGGLRTRDNSDFSIALIDAWAVVADILTFYQERLINEGYLRTAVDQRSVFELARLVGYRPSPGVSASAFLAFTLSSAPGSPDNVLIPAGTRVQSVPGPGQSPQVFETSQDLTAQIANNAIPAQTTVPWAVSAGDSSTTISGASHNLNAGDGILFVSSQLRSTLTSGAADFHIITSAVTDSNAGTTTVSWDGGLASAFGESNSAVYVYVFRKKAALFGVQAPDPRTFPSSSPIASSQDWVYQYTSGSMQVNLDASYPGLGQTPSGEPQWAVFVSPAWTALFQIASTTETGPVLYTLTSKTTQLTLANCQVIVNNALAVAVAAVNAAWQQYLIAWFENFNLVQAIANLDRAIGELIQALGPVTADEVLGEIVAETRSATAFVQSELLPAADPPFFGPWPYSGTYATQAGLLRPVDGANLEIAGGQELSSGQAVAISGKPLRVQVVTGAQASFVPQGASGALAVSDGQEFVTEAFPPANLSGFGVWQVTTTSGVSGVLTVAAGNLVLLPAGQNDAAAAESAVISQTSVAGAITTLSFDQPLARIYDRSTVTVNANTVAATNGETMHEILGSGDATNAALEFTLKQSPLTYTSSTSGLGAQSTLQVWVNNLQWHEVDNFLESLASDRVFVTSADQNGKVTVQFGDGVQGARTPTGQMNIRAQYRKGIGAAGMVQAGQLSQPLDRPQGLKGVTNPDPATGGADPDTADDARTSAPLHILTLDRVVSLEDYQNFSRAFAGIAKALATWTWFNRTRGVFITVAGANGSQFQAGDPTIVNLTRALQTAGNPYIPLQVVSYTPVLFEIAANVRVDGQNYDPNEVLGRVWQSLAAAFAFEARDLGQGVAQSEVVALIQQNAGVIAVELTAFNRSGQAAVSPLPAVLRAAAPITGGNVTPQAAEMLLLDPASRANIGAWS
ncbi:MAG TPA: putative baseplate assembly protein [Bryobacteraceae bacterium]|nr:putative baseplate assembly protein [Bryobacteraceae bacterium]